MFYTLIKHGFDQSERAQGPIYIIKKPYSRATLAYNTSNEQIARSYYMLNQRIRGLFFHFKKKLLFCNWLLFFW